MASREDRLVRRLAGASELALALDLRAAVFCGEQGISLAAEQDGRDGEALHLGLFEGGALVGTCRLLEVHFSEPIVQRVAVRADRRGRGFGRALIERALVEARRGGAAALTLHAQLESEGFYRGQGFTREGRPFVEAGIEHVAMRRALRLS
ncbi:MAG: GNAT family N-acetyltransferase [Solirubrobacteraceae bacterium]